MIKKLLLCAVVLSQFAISCSSDETEPEKEPVTEEPTKEPVKEPVKDLTLAEQIAALVKQPYSALTPADQKVKLEAEANEMLVQLDKSKSSSAIAAIENLNILLDLKGIDIFNGKNDNKVEDVLNVSGVYGVYTWNNTAKSWTKTESTTELKFVFPAKKSQTANNAILSAKSVSSTVKVELYDGYNGTKEINDNIFLPSSSDATLTIDNVQAASFTQTAKYSSKNQSPDEFAYKMILNDGYTWEMSGKKAAENTSKASLTYNAKNLISFNIGSSASIDALIDNDALVQYRGKANGLIQLMDNFVIIADVDLAAAAADDAALEKSLVRPTNYNSPTYYTDISNYNLKVTEGAVANFNKNMKLILVSKKDGTKIADIVQHTEKEDGDYETKYYNGVYYLKFSDKTEAEMSVYFSEGFDKFETKFEDFIKAFNK
ncbi:hypothetical protein KHA90_03650 [Flavobacterium psychroterrae]|uniref:DUF4988 domain-containing protein n=1 Tax=Flavobacterium psychroterrae TaxID=2133767 RepID=A0ABS5P8H0_9FLAO|nr:hypothetical protein [Flavobacterium psychroterrae]MBS7230110.1 hypothetical protein [Flavobacterium psychroterrae]